MLRNESPKPYRWADSPTHAPAIFDRGGNWTRMHPQPPLSQGGVIHLHSPIESCKDANGEGSFRRQETTYTTIYTFPHRAQGRAVLRQRISAILPDFTIFDSYQTLGSVHTKPLDAQSYVERSWLVNASTLGAAMSCIRRIAIIVGKLTGVPQITPPLYIFDVALPGRLGDYLGPFDPHSHMPGTLASTQAETADITEPALLGSLSMDTGESNVGSRVRTPSKMEGAISSINKETGLCTAQTKHRDEECARTDLVAKPTRLKVFSSSGVVFPFGIPYASAGVGHIIVYDATYRTTRRFTAAERWIFMGEASYIYSQLDETNRLTALLGSSTFAICLYVGSVSFGVLASTHSDTDRCGASLGKPPRHRPFLYPAVRSQTHQERGSTGLVLPNSHTSPYRFNSKSLPNLLSIRHYSFHNTCNESTHFISA